MRLSLVTLLVPEYRAGIDFFVAGLGWHLQSDEDQGGGKRWVVVAPPHGGTGILLARATTPAQIAAIGRQCGDRIGFFLTTEDFARDAARITAAGGIMLEAPRNEPYGIVAKWRDPFGNDWDLIQPAPAA